LARRSPAVWKSLPLVNPTTRTSSLTSPPTCARALAFRGGPAVIGGIELRGRHAVVTNNWRNDLERICEELERGDESPKQPRSWRRGPVISDPSFS
jgi:hypothetical protein